MKVKTGKLLSSLIRAGTRTAKLFAAASAAASAAPKPKAKPRRKPAAKPRTTTARGAPSTKPATPRAATAAGAKPAASRAATGATSGVSQAVAPGKWLSSHLPIAAGKRMSYWLYLPDHLSARAASKGLPLVVMLHGCQQTATQFAQGTRMNLWAEKMSYAVLYPQQLASSHPQRCWKWYDRATQEGGGDVRAIVDIVDKVRSQYPIDRSRIYVAGISAGAGMANIVALNHPELFAAVGLHSGPVFGAGHNTLGALSVMKNGAIGTRADIAVEEILQRQPGFPGMPAILIQGEHDHVVRPVNQLQLMRQSLLLNRLAGPSKRTDKPRGRSGSRNAHQLHEFYHGSKPMLRVVRIDQLEHAWSGGDPELAFNERAGPDASKMMLEFFSRHHRPC